MMGENSFPFKSSHSFRFLTKNTTCDTYLILRDFYKYFKIIRFFLKTTCLLSS